MNLTTFNKATFHFGICCIFFVAGQIPCAAQRVQDGKKETLAETLDIQDMFEKVRYPQIVVAQDGTVLAFAGGCRFLRRSEDEGRSWSRQETVIDFGTDNPASGGNAMVDENTGDVLIVYSPKSCLWRSRNSGRTWTKEEIAIRPNAIGHGTPDKVPAEVMCSASGITLRHGEHKGRLLMPARIQPPLGNNDQEYWQYNYNTSIYSEDGAKTWQVGEPVQSGTGEGTLAELSDGRIYYNSRCHMAVDHRRLAKTGGFAPVD